MNFDNLMHYDLMTGLYRFILFFRFCIFVFDRIQLRNSMSEKNLKFIRLKQ